MTHTPSFLPFFILSTDGRKVVVGNPLESSVRTPVLVPGIRTIHHHGIHGHMGRGSNGSGLSFSSFQSRFSKSLSAHGSWKCVAIVSIALTLTLILTNILTYMNGVCLCGKDANGSDIPVPEPDPYSAISTKCPPAECSGHGFYDRSLQQCICDSSWTGPDCTQSKSSNRFMICARIPLLNGDQSLSGCPRIL